MQQAMAARARRWPARLPRVSAGLTLELALLAFLAVQCARLFWAVVTPIGPVGDLRAAEPTVAGAPPLGQFDPFFRNGGQAAAAAVVTSLDLKLFGVREDRATGRGSAIIGTPDGAQASVAVGEEIMPGVTLTAVAFDSVTISRNGATEQIFLDQSQAAPQAAPVRPQAPAPAAAADGPQIQMAPRTSGGRVTGIVVQPGGSGEAFRAAGFAPGDVIVSVNGQAIASAEQARALVEQSQGEVSLVVDRAGRQLPLRVRLNR